MTEQNWRRLGTLADRAAGLAIAAALGYIATFTLFITALLVLSAGDLGCADSVEDCPPSPISTPWRRWPMTVVSIITTLATVGAAIDALIRGARASWPSWLSALALAAVLAVGWFTFRR